jgi:hypothetical protein
MLGELETMKNGIYYTKGPEMCVRVGSEPLDEEDRSYFTHLEFWHHGKMVSCQDKKCVPYATLLDLNNKIENESKSVPQVLLELVGI